MQHAHIRRVMRVRPLSHGAAGAVAESRQPSFDRLVAGKVHHPGVTTTVVADLRLDGRAFRTVGSRPSGTSDSQPKLEDRLRGARVRQTDAGIVDASTTGHLSGVLHRGIRAAGLLLDYFGNTGLAAIALAFDGASGRSERAGCP